MVRGNLPIMVSPLFSLAEPISIRPNVFGFSFYAIPTTLVCTPSFWPQIVCPHCNAAKLFVFCVCACICEAAAPSIPESPAPTAQSFIWGNPIDVRAMPLTIRPMPKTGQTRQIHCYFGGRLLFFRLA